MMRLLLIFIMICFCSFANDRREELLEVIDQEILEVARLNRQIGRGRPDLMLRMAELYLEKARIIKEKENERFLRIPKNARLNVKKAKFFKGSRKIFLGAQRVCEKILSNYKDFSSKANVYYILAYNAKEFGQHKRAKGYFNKAVRSSAKGSIINNRSRIALAELYFVNGQFKNAIPLYERSLRVKKDKWWTKDSYNLAWSYYRVGNTKKAISLLKKVYYSSKKSKFVDMSLNVERDLAYFYAESGNIAGAVSFYKKNSDDLPGDLLRMARFLTKKGKYVASEELTKKAISISDDDQQKINGYIKLLDLHEKFAQHEKHIKVAYKLKPFFKKKLLDGTNFDKYLYHIKKMSAKLQKQVIGKSYRHRKKIRTSKMHMAKKYFSLLNMIEPGQAYKNNFHLGETYYANGWYSSSLKYYDKSLRQSKAADSKKYEALALDGMMAVLSLKKVKGKKKYIKFAYVAYINKYPRGKKSYVIYQRLFALQIGKNIKDAEETLRIFKKAFPKSQKIQEAMIAQIMEKYRKLGSNDDIERWVGLINNRDYIVSKKYAQKLRELLLAMEFSSVEKATARGNKKEALRGYLKIYASPKSSSVAKKQAAYNIAILFHELKDVDRTYLWSMKALSLMGPGDVAKFRGEFVSMATEIFNRQRGAHASKLYTRLYQKVCRRKISKKGIILKNAIVVKLANSEIDSAILMLRQSNRCGISKKRMDELKFDIIQEAVRKKHWSAFEQLSGELQRNKKNWCKLIPSHSLIKKEYLRRGSSRSAIKEERLIMSFYDHCRKEKLGISVQALDAVAEIEIDKISYLVKGLKNVKLSFPEQIFNAKLKLLFSKLDTITTRAIKILQIGSGKGIVRAYKILVENYRHVVQLMRSYDPPGKSKDYQRSFRLSMVKLSGPIQIKANEFFNDALDQIKKNKILSIDNSWFLGPSRVPLKIKYSGGGNGLLMDREGR